MKRKRKNQIPEARQAGLDGNLNKLGRLINTARNRIEKGTILCILASEYALRVSPTKKHLRITINILNMGRNCLIDEYYPLLNCLKQKNLIRRVLVEGDTEFAEMIIKGRERRINDV